MKKQEERKSPILEPVKVWFAASVQPAKTLRKQAVATNFVPAVKFLWFAAFLTSIVAFWNVVSKESMSAFQLLLSFLGVALIMPIIFGLILGFVVLVLMGLSQILGGKGSIHQHFQLVSIGIGLGFFFAYLLTAVGGGWAGMVGFLYGLYVITIALREAHDFSTLKAAAVWLVPSVLLLLALFLYLVVTGQVSR